MKAIVNTAPNELRWQDWPTPAPAAGQVRIRVAACGICGTDLEMLGGWDRTGYPTVQGHEWSGTVDAVGPGVDAALVGRGCVADNVWADGGEVGFEHAGGFGEYLVTEAANVRPLPPGFPLATAALAEPLAVCVRGLRRLELSDRSCAVVFGDGTIGLMMLLLLRQAGVQAVTLVGGRASRLRLAQEFGAAHCVNHHELPADSAALSAAVRAACGAAAPNVIEASGSAVAAGAAMLLAAHDGRILLLGDYAAHSAAFRWNRVLHGELHLVGSNASAGAWDEAVRLLTAGDLPFARLISHRVPAARFADAFALLQGGGDAIKVMLEWTDQPLG